VGLVTRAGGRPEPNDAATATIVRSGQAGPRPLGAVVRVIGGRAQPSAFRLTGGTCVLGSASTCDLVIGEAGVSRQHVELALVPEGVKVTDLGSRNGTWYLGQRVERMSLALGARIKLGATEVAFDADTESLQGGAVYAGEEFRGMVGASLSMRRVFATLARLEGSLVSVLVQGESGVGKELVARALHEGSGVAAGPLEVLNCGAIPRDLVASELFGHTRGAFTGAAQARRGAFECADLGTLFLDEIGELPLDVQPVLLRALETGEVRPVGADNARNVRVRVVAATNRDLEAEVRAGRFREDLYYRLAVVKLTVPPLRERPEDIGPLAHQFAGHCGIDSLPQHVVEQLKARAWPGNARELRNVVQAFAALGALPEPAGSTATVLEMVLGDIVDVKRTYAEQKEELCERFTRIYLQAVMVHSGGNQSQAAKLAGLDRSYLGKLLAKHRLSKA
jgi:transcriptional regulator with GAF, ATPase, and Fis domain